MCRWLCAAAAHGAEHGVCSEDKVIPKLVTLCSHNTLAFPVIHIRCLTADLCNNLPNQKHVCHLCCIVQACLRVKKLQLPRKCSLVFVHHKAQTGRGLQSTVLAFPPGPPPLDEKLPGWEDRACVSNLDIRRNIFCNRSLNMTSIKVGPTPHQNIDDPHAQVMQYGTILIPWSCS